jgi:hypothetical protein
MNTKQQAAEFIRKARKLRGIDPQDKLPDSIEGIERGKPRRKTNLRKSSELMARLRRIRRDECR